MRAVIRGLGLLVAAGLLTLAAGCGPGEYTPGPDAANVSTNPREGRLQGGVYVPPPR